MNLPTINEETCPPANCGYAALEVRPSLALLCLNTTAQFVTYLVSEAGSIQITSGLYSSSAPSIASVDSNGLVTVHAVGIAVITVTWQGLTATAKAAVKSGTGVDCCENTKVRIVVVGDESKSMHTPFAGTTRRDLTDAMIASGISPLPYPAVLNSRTKVSTILFSDAALLYQPFTTDPSATIYPSSLPVLLMQPGLTNIAGGLALALTTLATDPGDQQVVALFSDGNDRPDYDDSRQELIATAKQFKDGGGVIIVIGLGATAEGFDLLRQISSSGFFINVLPESASAPDIGSDLTNMLCLLCAGDRPIFGYVDYADYTYGCAGFDGGAQVPDPSDYGDVEEDVSPERHPNLPQLPPVKFVPTDGSPSNSSPTITLSCPGFPEAFIRFTYLVGGSVYPADPTFHHPSSLLTGKDYDGAYFPIPMPSSIAKVWIKAIARKPGYNNSIVSSAVYPI